ncbi:predicted protein [Streptomyces sp. SPB78]|uniref:hypothetical protein n=1 Tax=Streptomyces sp. (strain SPB78) TaxID=591157 RepID=UPI0001B56EAA|nr:hypothetical protein [Streptomyces sp. SPB78]EFL01619.1 predicted protein [Streptomyces sp. SPB78]
MTRKKPGEWPVKRRPASAVDDEQRAQLAAERARFHVTLGSVRADLEEQPSPALVLAAGRRWTTAITAMADEIAQKRRRAG